VDEKPASADKDAARAGVAARARLRLSIGAGIVLLIVAAGIAVLVASLTPHGVTISASAPAVVHSAKPHADDAPTALVHVVGAVQRPGIYELSAGDRILDAVSAAGGFAPTADQAELNLAQVVTDGEQITVVKKGAVEAAPGAAPGGKVDLNTADLTALQTLDGIGPALAQRILDYRKAHGGFSAVGDLQDVSGIGDKKFAAIKDHVTT
jgi:competence protein ComEA